MNFIYVCFYSLICIFSDLNASQYDNPFSQSEVIPKSRPYDPHTPYTIEEFKAHGFLVRVGRVAPEYREEGGNLIFLPDGSCAASGQIEEGSYSIHYAGGYRIPPGHPDAKKVVRKLPMPVVFSGENGVSYWCLNTPPLHTVFYNGERGANAVIIKKITPAVLNQIVNYNPYEVMVVGPVILESGDALILIDSDICPESCFASPGVFPKWISEKDNQRMAQGLLFDHYCQAMKDSWQPKGIDVINGPAMQERVLVETEYEGNKYYQPQYKSSHMPGECKEIIEKKYVPQGFWKIDLTEKWFRYDDPFFVDGAGPITDYETFFRHVFAAYPQASWGYEWGSCTGIANLFAILPEYKRFVSSYRQGATPTAFDRAVLSFFAATTQEFLNQGPQGRALLPYVTQHLEDIDKFLKNNTSDSLVPPQSQIDAQQEMDFYIEMAISCSPEVFSSFVEQTQSVWPDNLKTTLPLIYQLVHQCLFHKTDTEKTNDLKRQLSSLPSSSKLSLYRNVMKRDGDKAQPTENVAVAWFADKE